MSMNRPSDWGYESSIEMSYIKNTGGWALSALEGSSPKKGADGAPKLIRPIDDKKTQPTKPQGGGQKGKKRGPYKPRVSATKTWSLVIVGIFMLSVLATGIAMATGMFSRNAVAATNIHLFNTNGTLNATQATNILNALNANNTAVANRDTQFRLFPDVGSGNVLNLSRLTWRITHVNGDRVTLWASAAYRNSQYHTANSFIAYNNSTIRSNLLADWGGITAGIAGLGTHVLSHGTTATHANTADLIWLPELADVGSNNSAGVRSGTWNMTPAERTYNANGFSTSAFLRSPNDAWAASVTTNGNAHANGWSWNASHAVRPALHLSLSSLAQASSLGGTIAAPANPAQPNTATLVNATNGQFNPDLAQALHGAAIGNDFNTRFRLFPDRGAGNTLALSRVTWRVLAVNGDRVSMIANEAYRNDIFHASNNAWNGSTVRTNLTNDFAGIINIPGLSAQMVNHGGTADGMVAADMIWVPSWAEISARTVAQRGYQLNGQVHHAWLRTPGTAGRTSVVTAAGNQITNIQTNWVGFNPAGLAVRPVINLSLAALAHSASLRANAANPPTNTAQPTTTPLIGNDGFFNQEVAQLMQNAVTASDFNTRFRLFPDRGAGNTLALSRLTWRILSVNGDRVNLIANEAYRNDIFHASSNAWNGSTIRTNLTNDFAGINDIPGLSAHMHTHGGTADGMVASDRIWIPSWAEISARTDAQRGFQLNGTVGHAWLRTPGAAGRVSAMNANGNQITGVATNWVATNAAGLSVRPVVSFSMTSIANAVVEPITDLGRLVSPHPLFRADGTINDMVAHHASNYVDAVERDVRFRLFPDVGTGNTLALSQSTWRIVDVTPNHVTFWASESYRTSAFHATSNVYSGSAVRTAVTTDFAPIANIPGLTQHLVPLGTTAHNGVAADLAWLPAENEIRHLTNRQRAFHTDFPTGSAWLRSATPTATWAWFVDAAGEIQNNSAGGITLSHNVRPAIRISRQTIHQAATSVSPNAPSVDVSPDSPILWSMMRAPFPPGGNGSPESPFLISSNSHLAMMAFEINSGRSTDAHFRLTHDITLTGPEWIPIGTSANPFTGSFDGDGFHISGLNVIGSVDTNIPGVSPALFGRNNGLFGVVGAGAHIHSFSIGQATDIVDPDAGSLGGVHVTSPSGDNANRFAVVAAHVLGGPETTIFEDIVVKNEVHLFTPNNASHNHRMGLIVAEVEEDANVTIRRIDVSDRVFMTIRRTGGSGNTISSMGGLVGFVGNGVSMNISEVTMDGAFAVSRIGATGTAAATNQANVGGLVGQFGEDGELNIHESVFNGNIQTFGNEASGTSFVRNVGGFVGIAQSETAVVDSSFAGYITVHGDVVGAGVSITQRVGGFVGTIAADLNVDGSTVTGEITLHGISHITASVSFGGVVGSATVGTTLIEATVVEETVHTVTMWGIADGITIHWGGFVGGFTGDDLNIIDSKVSDFHMYRRLPNTVTTTNLQMGGFVGHFSNANVLTLDGGLVEDLTMTGGNMHNASGQGTIIGNFHTGVALHIMRTHANGVELTATSTANLTGGQGGFIGRVGTGVARSVAIAESSFAGQIINRGTTGTATIGGVIGNIDAGELMISQVTVDADLQAMNTAQNRIGGVIGHASNMAVIHDISGTILRAVGLTVRDVTVETNLVTGTGASDIGGVIGFLDASVYEFERIDIEATIATSTTGVARLGGVAGFVQGTMTGDQSTSVGVMTDIGIDVTKSSLAASALNAGGLVGEVVGSIMSTQSIQLDVTLTKPNAVGGFNIVGGVIGLTSAQSVIELTSTSIELSVSLGNGGAIMGGIIGEMRTGALTVAGMGGIVDMISRGGDQFAGGIAGFLNNATTNFVDIDFNGAVRTSVTQAAHIQDVGGVVGRIVAAQGRTDMMNVQLFVRLTTSSGSDPRVASAVGHVLGGVSEREVVRIDNSMFSGWVDRTGSVAPTIGAFVGHQATSTTNIFNSIAGPRSTTVPNLGLAGVINAGAEVNLVDGSEVVINLFTMTLVRASEVHGVELSSVSHPSRAATFHVGFGILGAPSGLPAGVHFVGWAISQEAADQGFATFWVGQPFNLTGDITLFAVYSTTNQPGPGPGPGQPINTITVTFNLAGGTIYSLETPGAFYGTFTQEIIQGHSPVRPTDPTRPGYRFSHWTSNPTTNVPFVFGRGVNSAITLYAVWVVAPTLTLTLVRGSIIHGIDMSNLNVEVQRGEILRVGDDRAPVLDQYNEFVFLGWALTRARANSQVVDFAVGQTFDVLTDMRIYAVWQNSNANFIPGPGGPGGDGGENPGEGGAISPLSTVHLFGVGGSLSNFENTRHFNPFIESDRILPTAEYMNTTFIQNNPRFAGMTFMGWYTTPVYATGTGPHLLIPENAGRTITFHARWV
ncbi:MAG: InlB B-repeat-containing protein [Firmicutes bacterium]|nr:InlB B-repeat-containing protein [Bacillota bacterium]